MTQLKLGQIVGHESVYHGKELLKVVGIRENEVELEGDYSGGTHNVCQKDWLPIEGVIIAKEECKNKVDGNCTLHNLFCKHPECEKLLFPPPAPEAVGEEVGFVGDKEVDSKWEIIDCIWGHRFKIGTIVTIEEINKQDYKVRSASGEYWWVRDNELSGSRWRGEQPDAELIEAAKAIVECGKDDLSNPKYDGYFEQLYTALSKYREPATPTPTCGASWVRASELPAKEHRERYYHTKGEDWFAYLHGDGTWTCDGGRIARVTHYLSESTPCLPTREEAEKWIRSGGINPGMVKSDAALAMYDWLTSNQKPLPTRSDVLQWAEHHSVAISANPVKWAGELYDMIFNDKK